MLFRFEAFLPDVSLDLIELNPLPVQSTPLTALLFQTNSSPSYTKSTETRFISTGYLTLSQIRKVVFLEEEDMLISTVPIVGVWVHFPNEISSADESNRGSLSISPSLIRHPVIWGACVRFLYTERIKDRVFADGATFLMVRVHIVFICTISILNA